MAAEPQLAFQPLVSGLEMPTCITNAGDGSGRLFLCEQAGYVRVLAGGSLLPQPFLDVAARSSCCGTTSASSPPRSPSGC